MGGSQQGRGVRVGKFAEPAAKPGPDVNSANLRSLSDGQSSGWRCARRRIRPRRTQRSLRSATNAEIAEIGRRRDVVARNIPRHLSGGVDLVAAKAEIGGGWLSVANANAREIVAKPRHLAPRLRGVDVAPSFPV
jgi:hypothetical protein